MVKRVNNLLTGPTVLPICGLGSIHWSLFHALVLFLLFPFIGRDICIVLIPCIVSCINWS